MADDRRSGGGSPAEIERVATEWYFRRDDGLTPEEAMELEQWLREKDAHSRTFAAIERTWNRLGDAREKVVATIPPPQIHRRRLLWFPATLAAAAAIAIGFVGWRQIVSDRTNFAEQAATGVGGLRKIDLPDGSFVTLNTDSAVDVQFSASERHVRLLRGEAHFSVAPDRRRTFVVEANGVSVKAVGTAFNVRLRSEAVEVLVTEGKVRVDDAARGESLLIVPEIVAAPVSDGSTDKLLRSGHKVIIPVRANVAPVIAAPATISAEDIEKTLAWQNRRLEYVDAPLSEIAADFNRYNQHRLVIVDPRLASRRFGGSFPAGDYNSLVEVLENTFGVVAERRARETVLRLP